LTGIMGQWKPRKLAIGFSPDLPGQSVGDVDPDRARGGGETVSKRFGLVWGLGHGAVGKSSIGTNRWEEEPRSFGTPRRLGAQEVRLEVSGFGNYFSHGHHVLIN
jgi:hypothetical protein